MTYVKRSPQRPRVLFVLPPWYPTPPKGYGGIEAVAAALLPALERTGVEVILATPNGSKVEVSEKHELTKPLYPIFSRPYEYVIPAVSAYISQVMRLAWNRQVDLIHDFTGRPDMLTALAGPLPSDNFPPVIHTIHQAIKPYAAFYNEVLRNERLSLTAISHAQIASAPARIRSNANVIYNGINPAQFTVGPGGRRLFVIGRFCRDKGQDRLIEHCAEAGLELDVAGPVAQMESPRAIEQEVLQGADSHYADHPDFRLYRQSRYLIDGQQIKFHGNVSGQLKHRLLGHSAALVMPNRWAEPFGMVAIEAMASGTPVVAMKSGALPELIKHGVTGYLANNFDELCEYLKPEQLAKLDRAACRAHVEANFTMRHMAEQYLTLYRRTILQPAPTRARAPFLVPTREVASMLGTLTTPKRKITRDAD